jgi:hypothetical protein
MVWPVWVRWLIWPFGAGKLAMGYSWVSSTGTQATLFVFGHNLGCPFGPFVIISPIVFGSKQKENCQVH